MAQLPRRVQIESCAGYPANGFLQLINLVVNLLQFLSGRPIQVVRDRLRREQADDEFDLGLAAFVSRLVVEAPRCGEVRQHDPRRDVERISKGEKVPQPLGRLAKFGSKRCIGFGRQRFQFGEFLFGEARPWYQVLADKLTFGGS